MTARAGTYLGIALALVVIGLLAYGGVEYDHRMMPPVGADVLRWECPIGAAISTLILAVYASIRSRLMP